MAKNVYFRTKFNKYMALVNSYLQVEGLTRRVGDRVLFENLSLGIAEGQRVGLIAKNGTGKTTLLNILCGLDSYDEGSVVFKRDLRVGYLQQSPVYPPDLTIMEACFWHGNSVTSLIKEYEQCMQTPGNPGLEELLDRMDQEKAWDYESRAKQILSKLKIFDFDQKIRHLSGGQLKRVALANILITEPDLLILDEPTNHLDMRSKDVLKEAIRDFDGTVIVVSHDREFLDGLVEKVYEFGGGLVKEHLGGIYDFLKKKNIESLNELQLSSSPAAKTSAPAEKEASSNRLSYEQQKELQKKVRKLEKAVSACESEIENLEAQIAELEAQMATPEGAADMQLYEKHGALKKQLDETVERWETVSLELEEAKSNN